MIVTSSSGPATSMSCRAASGLPKATEEAHILLIEPKGTANTGDAGGERTAVETRI